MKRFLFLYAGALAAGSIGMAATGIDTTLSPLWDGSNAFGTLGDNIDAGSLATFGQVITVPATDTVLTDFSLALNANLTGTTTLRFYVFEWDSINNHTTGSALYASGTLNTFPSSFQLAGASGLSIDRPAGSQLVLVASAEEVTENDPQNSLGSWDSAEVGFATSSVTDAYASGAAWVKGYGGGDLTTLGDSGWSEINSQGHSDFAFTANFTSPLVDVPEAGTVAAGALLSLTAVGLAVIRSKAARA